MGRAIDRLPIDYETPRKQPTPRRSTDLHNDSDQTLSVPHRTPQEQADRVAQALANLDLFGAGDLAEMLGLREPVRRPTAPLDMACPVCFVLPRQRCVSKAGNEIGHLHVGRVRGAQRTEAVEQLLDKVLTEA